MVDIYNRADNFKGAIGGRWEPGQSGNPEGRQPNTLTTLLKQYLEQGDNKAHKEEIVEALVDLAKSTGVQGQVAALKEIFDRIEGKVTEKHINLSLTASVTPELLEQAQKRLSESLSDTQELIQENNATQ